MRELPALATEGSTAVVGGGKGSHLADRSEPIHAAAPPSQGARTH